MGTIPSQAKKVFEGTLFDVYQWEQELYDGSTATFEMLDRPDTVCVIPITQDGQVVMIDHEQPNKPRGVELPGGRVDHDEDYLAAAKRELAEETGYTGDSWELFYSLEEPFNKINWSIYYYLVRDCKPTVKQHPDPGERITNLLIDPDDFIAKIVRGETPHPELRMHFMQAKMDGKMEQIKDFLLGKSQTPF